MAIWCSLSPSSFSATCGFPDDPVRPSFCDCPHCSCLDLCCCCHCLADDTAHPGAVAVLVMCAMPVKQLWRSSTCPQFCSVGLHTFAPPEKVSPDDVVRTCASLTGKQYKRFARQARLQAYVCTSSRDLSLHPPLPDDRVFQTFQPWCLLSAIAFNCKACQTMI